MERGALGSKYDDRTNPLDQHAQVMIDVQGFAQAPPAAQMFGGAGREYRWRYGPNEKPLLRFRRKRGRTHNKSLRLI